MNRRNQGRESSFNRQPQPSENLFDADERILGAINAADASMQTAYPTSIHDLDPDPAQPRRVVPSAVRKAVPAGTRAPDLLEWWAVLAYQERHGHKPADAHQAHFYLRSVVAGEPEERDDEPGLIEAALLRVASLAADIRARGKLIHPIHITPAGRIVTGERRWLAHHLLTLYDYPGFDKIMAVEGEYDVWVQASENNQRSDLNAIGRARQFAILLMDLLKREGVEFLPLRDFEDEQDYYAQVADSKQYRIPTGGLSDLLNAMGVKGRQSLSNYRRLLSLPKDIWVIADDESWAVNDLLKIVQPLDNFDDLEQEPDTEPGQQEPVGESEPIPNIATSEQPSPVEDEHPNIKLLNLDGVPESVSWWGAYKDLSRDLSDHLFFIRARNDFFALREDAKALAQIVPSTMPGCHYTNTEFGMTFFCPQAVVDYVAESHLVAICDMRRKESVNEFWHTHMVINRRQKPAQQSTAATPVSESPGSQKWIPKVGDRVMTPKMHSGTIVHLIGKDKAAVKTIYSTGVYDIARLSLWDGAVQTDGMDDTDWPRPFALGERIQTQGGNTGIVKGYWQDQVLIRTDARTDLQRPIEGAVLVTSEPPSQDEQDTPRFVLPFTAEPDNITPGIQLVMDKNRRMVGSWRPSPAHTDESVQWIQGMVALTNGTMAHPQAQALFRLIEYLTGVSSAAYFPGHAMRDLELLRGFVDQAAEQMRKGGAE